MRKLLYITIIYVIVLASQAIADDNQPAANTNSTAAGAGSNVDWSNLSLDQLQNLKVTSVSKKPERAFDAAAAIYVITKEDIRRSGARSIPEALRLAPGVQVARAGANEWAISIRGFNDQFSNKLLVLMDGRSVYTPLFSGVYWDVQDTPLEDVKQIEVIRGPGATLWGANAVDGVINIITEEAANTQGKLVSTTYGNDEKGSTTVRVGGKSGDNTYYRIYGKYDNNAAEEKPNQQNAGDSGKNMRAGFRVDVNETTNNVTVQGDTYNNNEDQQLILPSLSVPFEMPAANNELSTGANLLTRWKHSYSDGSDSTLQIYYDHTTRSDVYADQTVNTVDFDFQHSLAEIDRNEITVGTGFRTVNDQIDGSQYVYFTPTGRIMNTYSAFIQDKIHIIEDKVFLTLGSKYEYNQFTQNELQPSARLSYLPTTNQTIWASVSRAVHTPDQDIQDITLHVAGTPFGYASLVGDSIAGLPLASSEVLIAYETGYRIQATKQLSFDMTAFYNDYSKLLSDFAVTPLELTATNPDSGESHGFEISSKWQATRDWDLSANYSHINMDLNIRTASLVTTNGKTPEDQYNLTSHYQFPYHIEMTNLLYTVAELPGIDIPSYTRFDTVFAWKADDNVELTLAGQNLFSPPHEEFTGFLYQLPEKIGSTYYANIRIRF